MPNHLNQEVGSQVERNVRVSRGTALSVTKCNCLIRLSITVDNFSLHITQQGVTALLPACHLCMI